LFYWNLTNHFVMLVSIKSLKKSCGCTKLELMIILDIKKKKKKKRGIIFIDYILKQKIYLNKTL